MEARCFICGKLGSEIKDTKVVQKNRACGYFLNRAAQPRIYEICLAEGVENHHEPLEGSKVCQKHDLMILRKSPDIRSLPADEEVEAVEAVEARGGWNFLKFAEIFKIEIVGILGGIC
jgi:hypothetical protein